MVIGRTWISLGDVKLTGNANRVNGLLGVTVVTIGQKKVTMHKPNNLFPPTSGPTKTFSKISTSNSRLIYNIILPPFTLTIIIDWVKYRNSAHFQK